MKKKIIFSLMAIMMIVSSASAGDSGMDNILGYMGDAIAMAMFILIFLITASWIYLPLGAAFLSYSHYKKKGETGAQEDSTLKMASIAMLGGLVGVIASYIIVGTFGMYAGEKSSLKEGNVHMIKPIVTAVQSRMGDKLEGN